MSQQALEESLYLQSAIAGRFFTGTLI